MSRPCLCVGPVVMMQAISNLTKMYNIKAIVASPSIMVDAYRDVRKLPGERGR